MILILGTAGHQHLAFQLVHNDTVKNKLKNFGKMLRILVYYCDSNRHLKAFHRLNCAVGELKDLGAEYLEEVTFFFFLS